MSVVVIAQDLVGWVLPSGPRVLSPPLLCMHDNARPIDHIMHHDTIVRGVDVVLVLNQPRAIVHRYNSHTHYLPIH